MAQKLEDRKLKIGTKVTINKPNSSFHNWQGYVVDVVHKGQLVHVISRHKAGLGFGDFRYDQLTKGWLV